MEAGQESNILTQPKEIKLSSVSFDNLAIGSSYDRNILAIMWGYRGRQAISRGVITPANSNLIILFVTKEKQASLTQYNDYISDGYLYWEGEEKGGNNQRIIDSERSHDSIHLFFRVRHHTDFTYLGAVELESYIESDNSPMNAVFRIIGEVDNKIGEATEEGVTLPELAQSENPHNLTTRQSIVSSRIGQGDYRLKLVKLWRRCSVTDSDLIEILVASHIKPWRESNNRERLDPYNGLLLTPNLDSLFDKGLISFGDDGAIMLSKKLSKQACNILNLTTNIKLRHVFEQNLPYLRFHRESIFQR